MFNSQKQVHRKKTSAEGGRNEETKLILQLERYREDEEEDGEGREMLDLNHYAHTNV